MENITEEKNTDSESFYTKTKVTLSKISTLNKILFLSLFAFLAVIPFIANNPQILNINADILPVCLSEPRAQETANGTAENSEITSVTTSSTLIADNKSFYLASVTTKPNTKPTKLSGLGLNWQLLKYQCSGRNQTQISIYKSVGVPLTSGSVTATFNKFSGGAAISVTRYIGVDLINPIGNVSSANSVGVNGICSGGSDTEDYSFALPSSSSSVVYGAVAQRNRTNTPGYGFIERADIRSGTSGNSAGVASEDKIIPSTSVAIINGSLSSSQDWAGAGIELRKDSCTSTSTSTSTPTSSPTPTLIPTTTATPAPTSAPTASTPTPTPSPKPTPTPTIAPTAIPSPTPTPGTVSSGSCNLSVSPGQSLGNAMKSIGSGQTLCVHGGTYTENISTGIASGARVVAYSGERPIVVGLMWLSSLNNVTIDGINVTWNSANSASEHMVKFSGGSGWVYQNSEVWGAHSFAGILISGGATNFKLSNLFVHDTYPSNSTNQDHLVYINDANGGIVERSLFVNSTNGRGIKLGPPSGGTAGPGGIVIRYNTFYNNLGPSNVQLSYGAHDNQVYRNIAQKSSQENITAYNLNGTGNTVHDNAGWESSAVASSSFDTGGNLHINPQFANLGTDFHPLNSQAQSYGKYAP